MQAAGVVRGAYQFFEPGEDPTAQANLLLQAMGPLQPGDLPPVLDMEVTGGQSAAAIVANVQTWMNVVEKATGVIPVIYTAPGFWNRSVGSTTFGANPLWVANWGVAAPTLPVGWSNWAIWQYSDTGFVPGILGQVDLDEFNGSLAELSNFGKPLPNGTLVTISAPSYLASRAPLSAGDFSISRNGDLTNALTVNLIIDPESNAEDYTLSGGSVTVSGSNVTVVIPAGQSSVDLMLTPDADTTGTAEPKEFLGLDLAPGNGYGYSIGYYTPFGSMLPSSAAVVAIAADGTLVTNTNSSGEGSLAVAIQNADNGLGDTISFAGGVSGTIATDIFLYNNSQIQIIGPGAGTLTIGGIYIDPGVAATISGLTIADGSSTNAGDIANYGSLTLSNTIITGGIATSTGGDVSNWGTLTLTDSIVTGGSANVGGGIANYGTLTVTNCTFTDNSAENGAAIANEGVVGGVDTYATLNVSNSTFLGNSATVSGGGIENDAGTLTVTNCTFSGNSASYGGAIFDPGEIEGGPMMPGPTTMPASVITYGPMMPGPTTMPASVITYGPVLDSISLANTIFAGNSAATGADISGTVTANNCLIQNPAGATFAAGSGNNIFEEDPLLGPLANNGGLTETMALLPGSPAIDTGSNALAVDAFGNPLTTDQRGPGYSRIINGTVDIGAYEYTPLATATTISQASPASPSDYGQPATLTATVAPEANGVSASGSVAFYDGSSLLGSGTLAIVNGVDTATFTTAATQLAVGPHSFIAVYDGDHNFAGSSSSSFAYTVDPAPTSTSVLSSIDASVYAQPVTFTATVVSDVAAAGTPTGSVTFFDGNQALATVSLVGGQATFTAAALDLGNHALTVGYNGATLFQTSVSPVLVQKVQSVALEPDPLVSGGTDLVVGGTPGPTIIDINSQQRGHQIQVNIAGIDGGFYHFNASYPAAQFSRLVVFGGPSGNVITVAASVSLPALLIGGPANDFIQAGGGPSVLVGGGGNDILIGGSNRNILIGDGGSDVLVGGGTGSILIGGSTDYDTNLAALSSILEEWARTDASYQRRIGHLTGTLPGGLNGSTFLNATTVHDDDATDLLIGDGGLDWFFASSTGRDFYIGRQRGEAFTPIS
jgi:hypothetical protein